MSIGPSNPITGSIAGTPAAEAHGRQTERARGEAAAEEQRTESKKKADAAAGITGPDSESLRSEDRDGDGRSPWTPNNFRDEAAPEAPHGPASDQSKVVSDTSGNLLDLNG